MFFYLYGAFLSAKKVLQKLSFARLYLIICRRVASATTFAKLDLYNGSFAHCACKSTRALAAHPCALLLAFDSLRLLKQTYLSASGFIVGNKSTSRIAAESVRSMHIRSMPKPMPPVGGIPISRACMKSSSVVLASSSPRARRAS